VVKAEGRVKRVVHERDLMWDGAGDMNRDGQAAGVRDSHDLRAFASLGFADVQAPFFALAKVASM